MKLLYCQPCGDILAPYAESRRIRYCRCGRHGVWWIDPEQGILRVVDQEQPPEEGRRYVPQPRAYVLGVMNSFLIEETLNEGVIGILLDALPDTYVFKRWRSPIIRIRPGESSDTGWATPEEFGATTT